MGLISNIQDKISHNKDPNVNASYNQSTNTTTSSTGHQQQTGTTATSNNPLSSNAPTHGSSGITGGTHPIVSGDNTTTTGYGSGEGNHLAGSTGQYSNTGPTGSQHTGPGLTGASHSGSGLTSSSHTEPGLTSNTHHTGTGMESTQHTGSGLTGTSHPSSGLIGSSHTGPGLTSNTHSGSGLTGTSHSTSSYTDSSHTGHGVTGSTQHTGAGQDNRGFMDKAKDALSSKRTNQPDDPVAGTNYDQNNRDETSGSGFTGASHGTSSHHNTRSGSQANQAVDFVPGSHPAANNDSAIPTAGGQRIGAVGEGVGYSGSDAGVHQTAGDRVTNALPGQHGTAHNAHGNPINPSSTGAHTYSDQTTGSHNTTSHTTGSHHTGGLTGSNTTHNNQPGSGFSSAAQPLSHDSNFNERHSGPGAGTGLAAGAVGGAGLASAGHHNSHSQTTGSQTTTHGSNYPVEDNRGLMDKAKDTLSSKRSNQPDDPMTGTNYDQKNRDEHTSGTHGTHSSGLTGSSHNTHSTSTHQPGVAGITQGVNQTHLGSNTHSGTHQPGVAGITQGVNQTHLGSNTHSGTHNSGLSQGSHSGRSVEWQEGYQAGYREATLALGSSSHSNTGMHSGAHSSNTSTGHNTTTGYTDNTKPGFGQKLNPKTDADRDGKVGIMD